MRLAHEIKVSSRDADTRSNRNHRAVHRTAGARWYYNNRDFDVRRTIFEELTGAGIFEEFEQRIAEPSRMQDFKVTDCFYQGGDASH